MENINSSKHIVLGVGNNDLSSKSVDICIQEMKQLIQISKGKGSIHVLPCFERIGKKDYNENVHQFNHAIQNLCESQNDVFFINNSQSINHNYRSAFQRDGIHFSETGKRAFVRLIKTHLNPHIGLKPYESKREREGLLLS